MHGSPHPGIIIDAFGEKRDDRDAMEEDMQDVDFVSGLPRSDFESLGLDFDKYRDSYAA